MNPALKQQFRLNQVIPALIVGLNAGLLEITLAVSFAALIFSGELSTHVSAGIGFLLFGTIVIVFITTVTSSYEGMIAGPQDSSSAIMALMAASISAQFADPASPVAFYTVVAAIIVTSITLGVSFYLMGQFNLGRLVRFIPYPVIGGFLAGTGWLVVLGAISVVADEPLSLEHFSHLWQPDVLPRWVIAVLIAIVLRQATRRISHYLVVPGIILGSVITFYVVVFVSGTSIETLQAGGWLLGDFPPDQQLWQPLLPAQLAQIDWGLVGGQIGNIITVVVISAIALLLNITGVELTIERDLNLTRELKSAGIANFVAGLGGGAAGYHQLSFSVLGHKTGVATRLGGVFTAVICGVVLLGGASLLLVFPKPVLGGVLIFLGLSFLVEWVYEAWFKLPRRDYAILIAILVVVVTVGYLQGILFGTLAAAILFLFDFSRVAVVKHRFSGATMPSKVVRPAANRQFLREHGEEIHILVLQGFLFFGTANSLLERVQTRLDRTDLPPLRYLILDFQQVYRLDSSVVSSFVRLEQLLAIHNTTLVLTYVSADMRGQLERGGLPTDSSERIAIFPELDRGIEWCEDELMRHYKISTSEQHPVFEEQLQAMLPGLENAAEMLRYLERSEVAEGGVLARQGDESRDLFFIVNGFISAQFELPDGHSIRVRTAKAGTVLGEIAAYTGAPRTAAIVAEQPSTVYRLTRAALERMRREKPEIAAALHEYIAHLLALRLAESAAALQAALE